MVLQKRERLLVQRYVKKKKKKKYVMRYWSRT